MDARNTPFANAVEQLLRKIAAEVFGEKLPDKPLVVVVAGGAAVHLYTGVRVSKDLDAEFLAKVLKPDAVVMYKDEAGEPCSVHLDRTYTNTLGLMHEDYLDRAQPSGWKVPGLDVRVLAPVDLAISKLGRWAENDRGDVKSLIDCGLLNRESLDRLANEAIDYYVGNTEPVKRNLVEALAMFPEPKGTKRNTP
jgi:hypothetical protein